MRELHERVQERAPTTYRYQCSDENPRRYGEPVTYKSPHGSKHQNGGYGETNLRTSCSSEDDIISRSELGERALVIP